jgi:hypothetical protein
MRTAPNRVFLVAKDDPRRVLLVRIAGAFLEQPTLRLTLAQAVRLWNLDADTCREHLAYLISAKLLELRDNRYQLAGESQISHGHDDGDRGIMSVGSRGGESQESHAQVRHRAGAAGRRPAV